MDIVKLILKKHGHYFLAVKENQKTLYEAIRSAFGRFRSQCITKTPEKGHGRIEQRTCRILSANKLMDASLLLRWEGIKTNIEIESVITIGDETSTNFRYYISDTKEDNSAYYNNLARNHWDIENRLHWHLDVNFREDASRARTNYAPQNLSLIRKIALEGIVRHKDKKSIAKRRFRACMSDDYLLNLLKSCNF